MKRAGVTRECRSCRRVRLHNARGLCSLCYKRHDAAGTLRKFPPVREHVTPRARYEAWVESGLSPGEYARELGIWGTSLSRALRIERERRDRLGLPWLDGWRKVHGIGT